MAHHFTCGERKIGKTWESLKILWNWLHELRVTFYITYELWVTMYCKSYELLFTCELRVITYCAGYELILTHELLVIIYCTSFKLNLSYKLQFAIYRQSWHCNVYCVTFLCYTYYSFLWPALYKTKYSSQLFLRNVFHEWVLQY